MANAAAGGVGFGAGKLYNTCFVAIMMLMHDAFRCRDRQWYHRRYLLIRQTCIRASRGLLHVQHVGLDRFLDRTQEQRVYSSRYVGPMRLIMLPMWRGAGSPCSSVPACRASCMYVHTMPIVPPPPPAHARPTRIPSTPAALTSSGPIYYVARYVITLQNIERLMRP